MEEVGLLIFASCRDAECSHELVSEVPREQGAKCGKWVWDHEGREIRIMSEIKKGQGMRVLLAGVRKEGILCFLKVSGFGNVARVAQLDRVAPSEGEGCGFNSRHAHHFHTGSRVTSQDVSQIVNCRAC
ncbi:MAG: hypothetical protein JWQ71_2826 [Pedosphaera sp.]|nr:hypothetical protein [Pedosphaera sp.]